MFRRSEEIENTSGSARSLSSSERSFLYVRRKNDSTNDFVDVADPTGSSIEESAHLGEEMQQHGDEQEKESTAAVPMQEEAETEVLVSRPPSPLVEGKLLEGPLPLASNKSKNGTEGFLATELLQCQDNLKATMEKMEELTAKVQKMEALTAKVQKMEALTAKMQTMEEEQEEMKKLISERDVEDPNSSTKLKLVDPDSAIIVLPQDLFTLLMVTECFKNGRPTRILLLFSCFILFQWGLCLLIMADNQVFGARGAADARQVSVDTFLGLPTGVNKIAQAAQLVLMFLAPLAQNDVFEAIRTLLLLRYSREAQWRKIAGEGTSFTVMGRWSPEFSLWFRRIFLPMVIKLFGAIMVLFVTWIIIVQSTTIIDLLKDFTALYILAELDDIMFYVADRGFFGRNLSRKTEKAKQIEFVERHEEGKGYYRLRMLALLFIWALMSAGAIWVIMRRRSGKILAEQYPFCEAQARLRLDQDEEFRPETVGNGLCDPDYNIEVCGYDGGDCSIYDIYPSCSVPIPSKLGDGRCDFGPYKTSECGLDDGDCLLFQSCTVADETKLGDLVCDFGDYMTPECQYDYGDCLEYTSCEVEDREKLGNGACDGGQYNTPECRFDGGDCGEFNLRFPGCFVDDVTRVGNGECDLEGGYNTEACDFDGGDCCNNIKFSLSLGNGVCDGPQYNTPECLYDRGDCLEYNELYPNCTVELPSFVGNGVCDGGAYNTPECQFDGGDCFQLNDPNCTVETPIWIGDAFCDGGAYNTPECQFDGGDCLEYNEKYPDCDADTPYSVGDGFCDPDYNTTECGYDGGDCLDGAESASVSPGFFGNR